MPLEKFPNQFTINDAKSRGLRGIQFYENKEKDIKQVLLPPHKSESADSYNKKSKITLPIAAEIIDRLSSTLDKGPVYSGNSSAMTDLEAFIALYPEWSNYWLGTLNYTLAGGNLLTFLRMSPNQPETLKIEQWQAPYIFKLRDGRVGYEYFINSDGVVSPLVNMTVDSLAESQKKTFRRTIISDTSIIVYDYQGNEIEEESIREHNAGFNPTIWYQSITAPGNYYSYPYTEKFDHLIVDYNRTFSQADFAIHVLQNVWFTNADLDNPENPITLSPGEINFLGGDNELKQAIRELTLTPEWEELEKLVEHIAAAAQVPAFFTGLRDIGKIPSGVALEIYYAPLIAMATRFRPIWAAKRVETAKKIIALRTNTTPDKVDLTCGLSSRYLPTDTAQEEDRIYKALEKGLVTQDEARSKIREIIGFDG